jgi:hypothetical protein
MAQSQRFRLTGRQGTTRFNWNWSAINIDSAVIVTAAEYGDFVGAIAGFKTVGRPILGSARVWVSNIGPHGGAGGEAGGVEFLRHVDWDQPLDVVVTVTVLDNIEDFFINA